MKKFGRLAALAALVLGLSILVSCKGGGGGSGSTSSTPSTGGSSSSGSSETNIGNVVATYVCANPDGVDGEYTLKFGDSKKFSATYKGAVFSGEISNGSYTGDPTKDGNIVFKVESYVKCKDLLDGQVNWVNTPLAEQTVTITKGKGKFEVWDRKCKEEYTRQ